MRVPIVISENHHDEPARLGEWVVPPGAAVIAGECVAECILPGLAIDILAPASGTLVEQLRQPEQRVRSGEIVGWIEAGDPSPDSPA